MASTLNDVEYRYNPEVEIVYSYGRKRKLVTAEHSYGVWVMFDLKGNFYKTSDAWNPQLREIGKIIRPRWDEYYLRWVRMGRGIKKKPDGKDVQR